MADNNCTVSNTLVTRFHLPLLGIAVALAAGPVFGQTPSFDVASIKPSEPITPAMVQSGKLHAGMKIDGARVDIGNYPLLQLIAKAYDVKMYQVSGPGWLGPAGQRFDIVANLPAGATKEQVPAMLQTLLAERFKLQVHRDNEPRSVFVMTVADGGVKMKAMTVAHAADGAGPAPGVTGSSTASVTQTKGGGGVISDGTGKQQKVTPSPDGKTLHLEFSGITAGDLAEGLTPLTGQPIVDKTGLTGTYEAAMDISMQDVLDAQRAAGVVPPGAAAGDPAKPADAASDPGGSVFTAMRLLGLKLERRKEPLLRIVVDHAEKMPTDN
jgi:uncharacterized protein (TIGR03435 family)